MSAAAIFETNRRHVQIGKRGSAKVVEEDGLIQLKFGMWTQIEMLELTIRSKLKPEVDYQYGDRLFCRLSIHL